MPSTVQSELIQWFIVVALPVLATIAFRAINLYASRINDERIRAAVLDLVAAAEQTFPAQAAGPVKLRYVAATASNRGLKVAPSDIEAAVFNLNASKPRSAMVGQALLPAAVPPSPAGRGAGGEAS